MIACKILAVVSVGVSLTVSCLYVLMALLMFGNFNFVKNWDTFVFVATFVVPVVTAAGYVSYRRRQTWITFAFSLAGAALGGLVFMLWISPQSRGLIH